MTTDVLRDLFSQAETVFPQFRVLWHGGEPSLAGPDFFDEAVELQPPGTANLVQTNGFAPWEVLQTWRRHGFRVSGSVDLPLDVNLRTRGESRLHAVYRLLLLTALYGTVGSVCVVSKLNVRRAPHMLNFVRHFKTKFNAVIDVPSLAPTPGDYADFLVWWAQMALRDPRLRDVEPVCDLILNVVSGRSRYCSFSKDCQGQFLAIDAKGDCYPCNRWIGRGDACYGNIRDGLDRLLSSPLRSRFRERAERLRQGACGGCSWFGVCHGGCPFEGGLTSRDPYCESYRRTREFVETYLTAQGAKVIYDETPEDVPGLA